MSVVDLHPEELLDRAHRGELTSAESDRLERHLAQCVACRLEHRSRSDFESFEGEEGHDAADFDVQRLLSEVLAPGADRELLRSPSVRRPSRGHRWQSLPLVAATLLIAGVAAAAGWTGVRALRAPVEKEVLPVSVVVSSAPRTGIPTLAAPPPAATEEEVSPPSPAPVVAPTPQLVLAKAADPPVHVVALDTSRETARVAPSPLPDAASLFDRANHARRSGDRGRATELYLELIARFPMSSEGHESEAVLGHLLLRDGDARSALAHLDSYLRTGGSLTEDVTLDRALALGHLGRASDEVDAWRTLLREYPSSVHGERARTRLQELGSP